MALLLLLIAAAAYLPYAGIPYFGDDYLFLSEHPYTSLYEYFVSYHDMGGEFRPFQMAWNALNQILFGEGTFLLQAGQVVLHALLAYLVFHFLTANAIRPLASFVAAALLAVHPIGVLPILGNDSVSQVGGTLLGFLSFTLAWRYGRLLAEPVSEACAGHRPGFGTALSSLAAFWLALLFKETSLSFAPILGLTVLYALWRCYRAGLWPAARKLGVLLLAYVLLVGLYFLYRHSMASTVVAFGGTDPYAMRIGPNIVANEVLLLGAALLPVSTVDAFVAVSQRALVTLAAMSVLALAWGGLLIRGLMLGRAARPVAGLLILAMCATMPAALMNHVSEAYAYNMAPFLAVVVALSLSALQQRSSPTARLITLVILVAVAAGDVLALRHKAAQMAFNGTAAASLAAQVVSQARDLPPGGRMLLVERPHPGARLYSVFLTTDFHGLLVAEHWLKHLAGRPDVSIQVVDEQHLTPADKIFVRENGPDGPTLKPRD